MTNGNSIYKGHHKNSEVKSSLCIGAYMVLFILLFVIHSSIENKLLLVKVI